tara:strand:+ start:130 stop:1032 length:903 start_codon:yes stop_codon:yes gene_type:complete
MHITIRQIQVFTAVAKCNSFTRAAEELSLTQPAVSMQIKQLEQSVGMPLFEQIGKKIYKTQAGEIVLNYAIKIQKHLTTAQQEINQLKGIESGHLSIGVVSTVNYFAARLLASFSRKYPNVNIKLDVTNRQNLLEKIESNEPDLVLMGQPPRGLDVHAFGFMDNPLMIIAAPDHPLATSKALPLSTLKNEKFIIREEGSGTRLAMERFFSDHDFKPKTTLEMAGTEVIKQSIEVGLGLSFLSKHSVELEIAAGRLIALDLVSTPIIRRWYIAHRKGKQLTATALRFKKFVLDESARQAGN